MRLATIAAALLLALTACGGDNGPDLAACEEAMRAQFADALATGAEGQRPSECDGVSDAELERIASEIIGGSLD